MSEDLKLSTDMIEKEKHPVSSEINMILDDPQTIALDQTVRRFIQITNAGLVKWSEEVLRQSKI